MKISKDERAKQGQRIRATRGLTGLSRNKFAKKSGISAATLQALEEKHESGITNRTFERLAEAFYEFHVIVKPEWLRLGKGVPPINLTLSEDDKILPLIQLLK